MTWPGVKQNAAHGKDPLCQPAVLQTIVDQRLAGESSLRGVMLESHLFNGCQPLSGELRYGVSIIDGCLGWAATGCCARPLTDCADKPDKPCRDGRACEARLPKALCAARFRQMFQGLHARL